MYPKVRLRRLRLSDTMRRMVRETSLSPADFVLPLFVRPGSKVKHEIGAMPGNYQFSPDMLPAECEEIARLGIPGIILFGIPSQKDEVGSEAYDPHGIIQQAIKAVKETVPELLVMTDVCLCEYTSHGHCGLINKPGDSNSNRNYPEGYVLNDPSVELLARMALSHAEAGADVVAPSDMMDGRVGAIRNILDENGFDNIAIMAYAAKFASAFYGPFREAAESPPQFGDRRAYQMDPANGREALREVEADIAEGADIVMVKPAMPYLDIIARVRDAFNYPVGAYNVSGEFSMVKAAAKMGWIDERKVAMEMLTSIKRAGADIILTYFAKDACRWLREE